MKYRPDYLITYYPVRESNSDEPGNKQIHLHKPKKKFLAAYLEGLKAGLGDREHRIFAEPIK